MNLILYHFCPLELTSRAWYLHTLSVDGREHFFFQINDVRIFQYSLKCLCHISCHCQSTFIISYTCISCHCQFVSQLSFLSRTRFYLYWNDVVARLVLACATLQIGILARRSAWNMVYENWGIPMLLLMHQQGSSSNFTIHIVYNRFSYILF